MPWNIFLNFFGRAAAGGGGWVVCYTAVYSVVTQRALRDDAKNGCVVDNGGLSQFAPFRSSPSFWLCCSAPWGKLSDFLFSQPSLCFLLSDIPDTSKLAVSHRSSIDVERFELDLLREFQSEWFEVAIWPSRTGDDFPEFFAPDEVIESFPVGSPNRKRIRTRSARRSPGRLHSESG